MIGVSFLNYTVFFFILLLVLILKQHGENEEQKILMLKHAVLGIQLRAMAHFIVSLSSFTFSSSFVNHAI